MPYRVRLHELAEAELDAIYADLRAAAGAAVAGGYVDGLYDFIARLGTLPERGTVRPGPIAGLRIIGYRRSASIAFVVEADMVTILGVFRRGQNVTSEMLERRR